MECKYYFMIFTIIIIILPTFYYVWSKYINSFYEEKIFDENVDNDLIVGKLVHPINITFDFSNVPNNTNGNSIVKLLKESGNIISNLVLCVNQRNLTINEDIISTFKEELKFDPKENITTDLLILPKFKRFKRKNKKTFETKIYNENDSNKVMPSISIIYINDRIKINKLISNNDSKYILLLESLRALTDCLGLNLKSIQKKKHPRNNFFGTPLYLIENYKSFKSINKLYNLLDLPFPQSEIELNGNFYISYWDSDSLVHDFRNENIDLKSDISEVSMNLLNDMEYYEVAKCDFKYYINNICYRIDQKCLKKSEFDLFYLSYGINLEKNNEIICYISDSNNLKKKQCGAKYGHLIYENLDFCPVLYKRNIKKTPIGKYEIPELKYYKNQTLNLLKPSNKCINPSPRTIYFKYENRNVIMNESNFQIETVTLNENQRNYFVSYLTEGETYFNQYVKILHDNGLIRSYYNNMNHNLFIKTFYEKSLKRRNRINKYQRLFHFIGNNIFFHKDELYLNYLYMKSYFPKSYNYMPKTYIYPKDKEKIEKVFKNYKINLKNLWIVKPVAQFSGKGIHLFKSLSEETKEKYLISKYLDNPHLIKGRKYDLRLYVLVTGIKPLRIYLNKEGLVRIAANNYSLTNKSLDDKFTHLTNTAINHESTKYVYPKEVNDENANKWNFYTYKKYLREQNIDINLIFEKIKDIVIKTIISGHWDLIHTTSKLRISQKSMFNLFGFDVLIDDNLNPSLLEVNTRPFMYIYDSMDKVIKTNLFIDTLNIVGIIPFLHSNKISSYDKEFSYKNKAKELVDYAICELTRPRGDFELIFPLKENIENYRKLFLKKASSENKMFWDEILKND